MEAFESGLVQGFFCAWLGRIDGVRPEVVFVAPGTGLEAGGAEFGVLAFVADVAGGC